MYKLKNVLAILALPWLYLWVILTCGFGIFKGGGGHMSGLAGGFLFLGFLAAIVIGIIEIVVAVVIVSLIF